MDSLEITAVAGAVLCGKGFSRRKLQAPDLLSLSKSTSRYILPSPRAYACIPFLSADGSVIPGRASVLRDLVVGYTGPGGFRISAFEGGAQDTDAEMDLWEGVDAVVLCAGRGGATRESGRAEQGGCEALVRFVSHRCVLHGKPLVWGWAGAAGEGGAGVEVNVAEHVSCLVRSRGAGLPSGFL